MDFHSLSRKELQALCKNNKIPANMTNIAMADALAALQHVEGLDKLLKPVQTDAQQFPEEKVAGTPLTTCRTSARREPFRGETESSKVSTRFRNGTRAGISEKIDQDIKDLSVPLTPAMPANRRRETAVSTRRKKDTHMSEDEKNGVQEKPTDVPKTPAAPSSKGRAAAGSTCNKLATSDVTTLQPAYSTRRSIRLLEKNLAEMSLIDNEDTRPAKMDETSEELSDISRQTGGSVEMEKGASSNMISAVDSEKFDALEVSTEEKNTEYECQSKYSKEEMQLYSEVATDAGAHRQVEPQEEPFDENSSYKCEPGGSNLEQDVSSETYDVSREVLDCYDELEVDLNTSVENDVDVNNEFIADVSTEVLECCDEFKFDMNKPVEKEVDVNDELIDIVDLNIAGESKEVLECCGEINDGHGLLYETEDCLHNNSVENEVDVNNELIDGESKEVLECNEELEVKLNKAENEVDVNNEFIADVSTEVLECCDEFDMNKSVEKEVDVNDELIDKVDLNNELIAGESREVLECSGEINEGHGLLYETEDCLHNNSVENEVDVNNELIDDESNEVLESSDELEVELNKSIEKEVDVNNELIADESKEVLECRDEINKGHGFLYETEDCLHTMHDALFMNVADAAFVELTDKDIAGFLPVSSANNDSQKPRELGECSGGTQVQENEHLHVADGNGISYSELSFGVSFENSVAIQACNESSVEDDILVENITIPSIPLDASLNYNDVSKEEEQKDGSENLDSKAGPETTLFPPDMGECKDHTVEEKTVYDVSSAFPCVADEKDDSSRQILVPDQQVSVKSGVTTEELSTHIMESLQPTDEIKDQIMEPKSRSIHFSVGVVYEEATHPLRTVPTYGQKTSEIPIQLNAADQLNAHFPYPVHSEPKDTAIGTQIDPKMICIQEGDDQKIHKKKENLNTDELNGKSMRQLRKMLKNLTLDGKTKKCNNGAKMEVVKKRTALQALPENQMAAVDSQKDS